MSKNLPFLFLRQYLSWMIFFQITRLLFLLWNREELHGLGFAEIIPVFFHSIYLDTAMTCWLMIIPWLLFTIAFFTEKKVFLKINRYFTATLVSIVSVLTIGELPVYDEWHTKLTYKAIWFLGNPSEVFHTATWKELVFGILGMILLSWFGIFLFKKMVPIDIQVKRKPFWQSISFAILAPGIVFLGMRGGYQQIPIQISDAYFSKSNVLNTTSVNSTFNLMSSWFENFQAGEPYHFMPDADAKNLLSDLNFTAKDTTIHILTTDRPNIVLVVLEGWSGDLVKSCGGYDSITPHFEEMIKEGVFFSKCYASGSLSDQGMAAIFSAFPAQTKTSVITQPTKYVHLSCINTSFKNAGYKTSFMFGGQLSYGNIRAYMYYNGFDKIIEGKDFAAELTSSKLGYPDGNLFDRQLKELSKEQEPFFASMFTLSSHSPFDMPMKEMLHWGEKERGYINSVYYADSCIHNFIESAKKTSWYKNTLFIFVSDHGHNSPKSWNFIQPEYHQIPMLFYGEVIKPEFRGMKYDSIVSQTDLASTLLHQLNLDAKAFSYSKNLFNPYAPRYAFYAFDEGFGLLKPEGQLCLRANENKTEFEKVNVASDKEIILKEGKAFLQILSGEYFRY